VTWAFGAEDGWGCSRTGPAAGVRAPLTDGGQTCNRRIRADGRKRGESRRERLEECHIRARLEGTELSLTG